MKPTPLLNRLWMALQKCLWLKQLCTGGVVLLLVDTCQTGPRQAPLFAMLDAGHTGLTFANTITESDSVNVLNYYYCYNGGGVAVGDFNNDGRPDLFFGGNMVSSTLYLNEGNLRFRDVTQTARLTTTDWVMGVSVVDVNNDGWLDVYLNVAGPERAIRGHNRLFINGGLGKTGVPVFTEQAAAYGLAAESFNVQSAFFDYDRDGDLDMYLMTNQVNGVDKNMVVPPGYPVTRGATTDRLYENLGVSDSLGHPVFVDVSARVGIRHEGYGLGLSIADLNADGWPDIYVANDFMTNDHLYINQPDKAGKRVFTDQCQTGQRHQSYNGMGVDVADINNDAWPDVLVVDMLPQTNQRRKTTIAGMNYEKFLLESQAGYVPQFMRNTLQLNRGNGPAGVQFSDIGQLAGVHATDWSWGPLLADFDNDGLRDLYITNGFVKNITDLDFANYQAAETMFGSQQVRNDQQQALTKRLTGVSVSNYVFRNTGQLTFTDETENWGINRPSYSNGAVYADLDSDGDLDLVTSNINEPAYLYENRANKRPDAATFLTIKLLGSPQNRQGIGSTVTVYAGNRSQTVYASPVRGYLSSIDTPLHIGMGRARRADSVAVVWPDGWRQVLKNVKTNQQLTLSYRNRSAKTAPVPSETPLFVVANNALGIHCKHVENRHNDFVENPLLLRQYDRGGPALAVGDVDGRQGDDFFVGGSAGQPGLLFRQQANGRFIGAAINQPEARCEDAGALFFDADNDGDTDLYVASGGSEFKPESADYQDRLYLNNAARQPGNASFTLAPNALPAMRTSKSCVVGADYDHDGDIDLFVGGRYQPGAYPDAPRSYLLQNNGGTFQDVTAQTAPDLVRPGMVSGAVWTDVDNDGWTDLICVGEWMPITFFQNRHGRLVNVTGQTGLGDSRGWWNSILPVDIDRDGDMDYVVGNAGTNLDYAPKPGQPLALLAGDFDHNKRTKPIVFQYVLTANGTREQAPFAGRDDLLKQWVGLRGRFLDYASYGETTLAQLLTNTKPTEHTNLTASTFETSIIENLGGGRFKRRALPAEAQFSATFGILADDFTGDGLPDLLLTGNNHAGEVLYGWADASLGVLLAGDGRGHFRAVSPPHSGLFLANDHRSLAQLRTNRGRAVVLAAANADSLVALVQTQPTGGRVLTARPLDAYALLQHTDGRTSRHEFSYGVGYLTQSARSLTVPDKVRTITIADTRGNRRVVPTTDLPRINP
ncbi:VCBS repeat-containing protein [Fibrella aquatilis]|uniref:VCBS repeat-containing protein n=1 Tax=Fibrella aquatilis TaxID=2817059 RepID=A0A939G9S9_9BACT|nr:VCBS repeat-containing protein [Fibrella aquatilis]MBO0933853.1 VCBS repeat-containing protein [Fibrella aquatilis]